MPHASKKFGGSPYDKEIKRFEYENDIEIKCPGCGEFISSASTMRRHALKHLNNNENSILRNVPVPNEDYDDCMLYFQFG